jgi:heptose-I-phosphate ethanolaminephosphotransferase
MATVFSNASFKKNFLSLIGLWAPFILLSATYFHFTGFSKRHLATYFYFMLLLILIVKSRKKKSSFTLMLFLASSLFSFFSFIEISHWVLFNHKVTESTIHIVLETTLSESIEFLSSYLTPSLWGLYSLFIVTIFFGVIYSSRQFTYIKIVNKKHIRALIGSCFILTVFFVLFLKVYFPPYVGVQSVLEYKKTRASLSQVTISKNGSFKNVIHKKDSLAEIYVIIIGESTTNHHMGLYNYYRNTNPLLAKRKHELTIYNQVISPHSHTIESLGKSLTLGEYEIPEKKYNNTLIQLFNSADFNTYWISNQKPVGLYETSTRLISKISKKSIYTDVSNVMYDQEIISPLKDVLNEKKRKKFIIIHLMGTHMTYAKRYPSNFNVFKENPKTDFHHERAYNSINHYDNAILYNDYIVDSIIKEVEKHKTKSFVLYFSDHGEDVYETVNKAFHDDDLGTKPMYDIPFILWLSKEYKAKKNDFVFKTDRKYSIENLIHTIADLSSVSFNRFDSKKSIVNSNFLEVTRIIANRKYYEEAF